MMADYYDQPWLISAALCVGWRTFPFRQQFVNAIAILPFSASATSSARRRQPLDDEGYEIN